jgi:glycosyltransferase involved in cell wall biosynthesis
LRILGLHDGSGCGYYRLVLPLTELTKHGHEVTLANYFEEEIVTALRSASDYDLVVAERLHKYEGLSSWRRARTQNNRLVFENDDNIFAVAKENWAAYNLYEKLDVREAVVAYSEWADMVTVTTEPLAEIFRQFNDNTVVLPNCLPDVAYVPYDQNPDTSNRRLRVGWVGGASHGRDVHTCTPSVRKFIKRENDWDLYLGGNDYRPTFKVPLDRAHFEPWHAVTDDTEAYYASMDFDIGLCPVLETDFAKSKSAIKAIEYGARGIPVIASDVTCYRDYVQHGYNGFLAKTDHEWLKYLHLLANDEDLRRTMGRNNRAKAEDYHMSSKWGFWEAAYQSMYKEKVR